MAKFVICPATAAACSDILQRIKELAKYKYMEEQVILTEKDLIVGFSMSHFNYDPWIGTWLYLEDFLVMSDYRGFGIGSQILKNISQVVMKCHCSSMPFLVAEWNEPSVNFYKRRGASDLYSKEGSRLFKIDKEYLLTLAAGEGRMLVRKMTASILS
uniref:Diamine acetyltransferase 1 n=1 Tax=Suricata suricatta TaxID=37032 RepID=A0A673SNR7_SURSU